MSQGYVSTGRHQQRDKHWPTVRGKSVLSGCDESLICVCATAWYSDSRDVNTSWMRDTTL